ncbi:hypothetical protein GCM10028786_12250 [Flaviaesturariibacter terrae]
MYTVLEQGQLYFPKLEAIAEQFQPKAIIFNSKAFFLLAGIVTILPHNIAAHHNRRMRYAIFQHHVFPNFYW